MLHEAQKNCSLIRFGSCFEPGYTYGYVLSVGETDFLIAIVSDQIWLNGFAAYKIDSIRKLNLQHSYAKFQELALKARGEQIPHEAPIKGSKLKEWMLEAGHFFPLITFYAEIIDPEICHIGRIIRATEHEFEFLGISAAAEWYSSLQLFQFKDITRIEFGDDYEDALFLIGGHMPSFLGR